MAPGVFYKWWKICATQLKPLRHNGFSFDGLITPTLKAAGSNPVGRTKMNDPTRFEQIVVTVHVRWGHLMPESLALQGFLVFLFFGVISSEICKLGKIEVQNA